MRSRYCAYVLDLLPYLSATWHLSTRPAVIEPNPDNARWLGLDIRRYEVIDADHAIVSFVARCRIGGKATRMVETSRFIREESRWFYVDGEVAP